jgi:hypothetical protein
MKYYTFQCSHHKIMYIYALVFSIFLRLCMTRGLWLPPPIVSEL